MCCFGTNLIKESMRSKTMKKLIPLLLAVLMCVSLCACGGDAEPGESQSAQNPGGSVDSTPGNSEPEQTGSAPSLTLSDDPADFTVSIDGIVYQLGDSMDTLLNDGWIPKSGYVLEDDYSIPAGEKRGVVIYQKNDKNNAITVWSYYPGTEASVYCDGIILGFAREADSTAEVVLAGGLKLDHNLTLQEVIRVFGEDYKYSQFNGDRYVYLIEAKGKYIFTFTDDHLTDWEFQLYTDEQGN